MSDPLDNQWREKAWRGNLTPTEQAEVQKWLQQHPDSRAEWESELQLNELIGHLPEAPAVSSNFTAQVLEVIEGDAEKPTRAASFGWRWLHGWLPKVAVASVIVTTGFVAFYQQHQRAERITLASKVARFADAVSATDPEMLKNFEPISRLSDSPPQADVELLAVMKK